MPAASEDLDFSDLKKKKKSTKKKAALDMEAFEKELQVAKTKDADEEEGGEEGIPLEGDETELGDDPFTRGETTINIDAGSEPWLGSDRDYTYEEVQWTEVAPHTHIELRFVQLLHRFYVQLHASNPALLNSTGKRYTIAPPQLLREGNKKTVFANVSDICKRMHRQPEHVIQYMFAEMGTTGSVDGSGRLVIRGRFQQKQIEHVLRRYIGMCDLTFRAAHADLMLSRIRYLQDMQVTRHASHEGESYFLHVLRVMRLKAVRRTDQDRFPGAGRKEKQKQDGLSTPRITMVLCISCVHVYLCYTHTLYRIHSTAIHHCILSETRLH